MKRNLFFGWWWRETTSPTAAPPPPVKLAFPLILVGAFLLAVPLSGQETQQGYRQFEIDTGASLYAANCAECHAGGEGIPGVNLRTGQFRHSVTDEDLMSVIQYGVPGTAMPPHNLPGSALTALVAFIRSMKDDQTQPVKLGDPEEGKTLFEGDGGCLNCHRVGGKGSRKALNLSDVGTIHPPSYLQKALLDPNAIAAATPESRMMQAVTNSGTIITGRRLNEDTYTLQLIDDSENLISLEKDDLRSLTVLKDSPMPSLQGKFTDDQIGDLVAYLASLKGNSPQTAQWQLGPPGYAAAAAAAGAARVTPLASPTGVVRQGPGAKP